MEKRNSNRKPKVVTKAQVKQMIKANTNKDWNKKYILSNSGVPGSSTSVDATGTVVSLSTVAQGTTNQTRVGNLPASNAFGVMLAHMLIQQTYRTLYVLLCFCGLMLLHLLHLISLSVLLHTTLVITI